MQALNYIDLLILSKFQNIVKHINPIYIVNICLFALLSSKILLTDLTDLSHFSIFILCVVVVAFSGGIMHYKSLSVGTRNIYVVKYQYLRIAILLFLPFYVLSFDIPMIIHSLSEFISIYLLSTDKEPPAKNKQEQLVTNN